MFWKKKKEIDISLNPFYNMDRNNDIKKLDAIQENNDNVIEALKIYGAVTYNTENTIRLWEFLMFINNKYLKPISKDDIEFECNGEQYIVQFRSNVILIALKKNKHNHLSNFYYLQIHCKGEDILSDWTFRDSMSEKEKVDLFIYAHDFIYEFLNEVKRQCTINYDKNLEQLEKLQYVYSQIGE